MIYFFKKILYNYNTLTDKENSMFKKKKINKQQLKARLIASAICIAILLTILMVFFNADTDKSFQQSVTESGNIVTTSGQRDIAKEAEAAIDKGNLIYYQLNAGNADCAVIITPNGKTIMIDAGDDEDYAKISQTLKNLSISRIDEIKMTHSHSDHIGAMDEIIENFEVGTLTQSGINDSSDSYKDVINAAENQNVPIKNIITGNVSEFGNTTIKYLNPDTNSADDINQSSITLMLNYKSTSILCLGDIESPALDNMVNDYYSDIDCDVLKVAHHGSKEGTTNKLLKYSSPGISIITCGKDNPYGHPDKSTTELLESYNSTILRSDTNGDILIISDGTKISCITEK